jgi:flavin-dependent dehydrogenase
MPTPAPSEEAPSTAAGAPDAAPSAAAAPSRAEYDAVVIGGGPGGTTAATLLARAGRRVLLLEKERFPRFRIGESLLPLSREVFERLGVADEVERTFIRKYGAHFVKADGSREQLYEFETALDNPYPYAYHVPRAELDRILLENARRAGVEALEGWRVEDVLFEGDPRAGGRAVGVRARPVGAAAAAPERWVSPDAPEEPAAEQGAAAGPPVEARAPFVIDASGRWSVLGKKLRLRRPDATLHKAAVFAHYRGVRRLEGRHEGTITIAVSEDGWFWIIPFKGELTSVGAVLHHAFWRERRERPEEMLRLAIERCPPVRERLAGAERATPVASEGSFSYRCDRFAGDGWVLCGDAAAFLDPIFSSGVLLTMRSAEMIAEAVLRGLAEGRAGADLFREYERRMRRGMGVFWRFIHGFYDASFLEIFMQPTRRLAMQECIAGVLAGNIFPSLRFKLRIWLLEAIVAVARRVYRWRGMRMPDRAGA